MFSSHTLFYPLSSVLKILLATAHRSKPTLAFSSLRSAQKPPDTFFSTFSQECLTGTQSDHSHLLGQTLPCCLSYTADIGVLQRPLIALQESSLVLTSHPKPASLQPASQPGLPALFNISSRSHLGAVVLPVASTRNILPLERCTSNPSTPLEPWLSFTFPAKPSCQPPSLHPAFSTPFPYFNSSPS